jgi:hypothetical protein
MDMEDIRALRSKWTKEETLRQLELTEERLAIQINEKIALEKLVIHHLGGLYSMVKNRPNDPGYNYSDELKRI